VSAELPSRRWLLKAAGLAGAAAVLPLSGCAASVPARQNGVTQLRFMQNKPEVVTYFNQVIKDFEALNPDIRVVQDFNEGNFVPSLVRNDPPDVVTRGFAQATADFTKKGVFADLSGLRAADTLDPKVQALVNSWGQYKGETSALPFSLAAAGVIYNREIFATHGVSVPTTWDEFLAACETFRAAGITPIYGTFKDPWTLQQGAFDYVTGGTLDVEHFFDRLYAKGTTFREGTAESFSSNFGPALPKILQLTSLTQNGAASKNYADGNASFGKGQAAMYLQGPWALSELVKANKDIALGSFPLPATNNPAETKVRVNVDMALSIARNTPNRAAAERFVNYLLEPSVVNTFNEKNAAFSPLKDAPAATNPQISGLAPYVAEGRYYQGAGTYFPPSVPLGNYIQAFVYNRNAEQFLTELDAEWRRVAERTAV
jgi:raffinose/stachyose/melibiose transport system substrate-binding protein